MARRSSRRRARTLDARPDAVDFRDQMYVPTLVEVPARIPPGAWRGRRLPVLDQGREGACTGYALATVVHHLLRGRADEPDASRVSPTMLYDMARRYDEWPGEGYDGSSARGAMKGWHKHGVCREGLWRRAAERRPPTLTAERMADAALRPLGAYFRVNHRDLVSMHTALAEAGALFATASVHEGWDEVDRAGHIPFRSGSTGGHAFVIVAYDPEGFWIQNSWGRDWGRGGLAHVEYSDWLANGLDLWVARLGAPVIVAGDPGSARGRSTFLSQSDDVANRDLRPHLVSLGNEGELRPWGPFGTSAEDVREIVERELPTRTAAWKRRRVLLYSHGGLVAERNAVQRVAEYLPSMLANEVWPLAFVWRSDLWSTVTNILQDALRRRRPEGFLDAAKDFLLDRLDDGLEPIARLAGGRALWSEMKENALAASTGGLGGAAFLAELLERRLDADRIELHVAAHSAGSILMAPLVQLFTTPRGQAIQSGPMAGRTGLGRSLASCTLWAPACTVELFEDAYLPAIRSGAIARFRLFTLDDDTERDDDCAKVYHKSLLYLVSHAFEARARVPILHPSGTPILGLERCVRDTARLRALLGKPGAFADGDPVGWVLAPNREAAGSTRASGARRHGDFDDDASTVKALLATIRSAQAGKGATFAFARSRSSLRDRRARIG